MVESENSSKEIDALLRRLGVIVLTNPNEIDLCQKNISIKEAILLCKKLKTATSVQVLKLCYNEIGDEGTKALSTAIDHHLSLRTLDLGFNCIGDIGAASLARSLCGNSALRTLYLSGNNIGEIGMQALSEALQCSPNPGNGLETLHLTGNRIGPEGVAHLASALKINKSLVWLYIGGGEIGVQGACAIASALQVNISLRYLHLSANKIGDQGIIAIAQSLQQNRRLRLLELGFNSISASGIEYLANSLWGYTELQSIYLDNNNIGDLGAERMAGVLPSLAINSLNLGFNCISTSGIQAVMKSVLQCSTLTSLVLSGNTVDTDAARAISATVCQPSCNLRRLSLEHAGLGRAGEKHVASGLLRNPMLKCKHFTGFALGHVLMGLGMAQQLDLMTNEQALDHIRASWQVHLAAERRQYEQQAINAATKAAHSASSAKMPSLSSFQPSPREQTPGDGKSSFPLSSPPCISVQQFQHPPPHGEGFNIGASPPTPANSSPTQSHLSRRRGSGRGSARGIGSQAIVGHGAAIHLPVPGWAAAAEAGANTAAGAQGLVSALRQIALLPFDPAELWELQQYFFSPPPNPSSYQRQEDPPTRGKEGDREDGKPGGIPCKKPANYRTCPPIACFTRLKAQIENLRGRDDPRVLTLLRQLKYLIAIAGSGGIGADDSSTPGEMGFEAILLDML